MTPFSIEKTTVGHINHKKEWDNLDILYSPSESLAIVEFLRTQYLYLHKLPKHIDKTIVGFRKPKRKKRIKQILRS